MTTPAEQERARRWRLVLGGHKQEQEQGSGLSSDDAAMDRALSALYGEDGEGEGDTRTGGLGGSAPKVARWLGDIRRYFPNTVVRVMQNDALSRLNLRQMLTEPELLEGLEPDIYLVTQLISLGKVLPNKTKDTARAIVRKLVEDLMRRLATPLRQSVTGTLNRQIRNNRPRYNEINWDITIRRNLKHYQPQYRTIIPRQLVGAGRRQSQLRDIILCIDQSGSMAASVVYASVFSAVLASIPAVRTQIIAFDTNVADLTEHLDDPVELLFATQLGGGTNINKALAYCQTRITRPNDTVLILISDLYEGGGRDAMLDRAAEIISSGVNLVTLLALNDEGAPSYDHNTAARLGELGSPAFACTPDLFPDLMAAALSRRDLREWAARQGLSHT